MNHRLWLKTKIRWVSAEQDVTSKNTPRKIKDGARSIVWPSSCKNLLTRLSSFSRDPRTDARQKQCKIDDYFVFCIRGRLYHNVIPCCIHCQQQMTLLHRAKSFILSILFISIPFVAAMKVQVGSQIPFAAPLHLVTLDGDKVSLVDETKPTVLCFLRHLA